MDVSYVKLSRKYARSLFLCCAGLLLKMNESSDWSLSLDGTIFVSIMTMSSHDYLGPGIICTCSAKRSGL